MYCDLALSPPRKNVLCASRRIDFSCIFNEIIASTSVQQDAVKLWRLGSWFMDLILHKCFVIHWKLLLHSLLHRGTTFLLEAVCNCVSIPQDKGPVKPIDFCTMYVYKRRCCHTGITRCGRCEVSARRPALKSDKREKECCHTVFKTPHRHYNEKHTFSHLEMQGCHSSASASGKTLVSNLPI